MGGPAWSKDWIGFYNELLSAFFNGIDPKRTSAIYCKIVYTAKLSECSWAVLTNFSPTEKRTSG